MAGSAQATKLQNGIIIDSCTSPAAGPRQLPSELFACLNELGLGGRLCQGQVVANGGAGSLAAQDGGARACSRGQRANARTRARYPHTGTTSLVDPARPPPQPPPPRHGEDGDSGDESVGGGDGGGGGGGESGGERGEEETTSAAAGVGNGISVAQELMMMEGEEVHARALSPSLPLLSPFLDLFHPPTRERARAHMLARTRKFESGGLAVGSKGGAVGGRGRVSRHRVTRDHGTTRVTWVVPRPSELRARHSLCPLESFSQAVSGAPVAPVKCVVRVYGGEGGDGEVRNRMLRTAVIEVLANANVAGGGSGFGDGHDDDIGCGSISRGRR